jgi:hypothetical protein
MLTKPLFKLAGAALVAVSALAPAFTAQAAPAGRPNAVTFARQFTPTIDGNLSEWGSLPYAINQVVYKPENWVGANDATANYAVAWDANKFYIAAYVKDDVFVQTQTGDQIFKGDGLELLWDTLLSQDSDSTALTNDDFELGISPGGLTSGNNPAAQAYRWYPSNIKGAQSTVVIASTKVGDGYQIEVGIPWPVLGAQPFAGARFGFALSVSDNDAANTAQQQTLVSSVNTRKLTNPTTWGTLILDNVTTHAVHFNSAPTIDGNLGEWGTLDQNINQVTFGASNWVNTGDASATYKLGWDNVKLYIATYVKDDVFVQNQTGKNLFKGDSLELLIDNNLGGDAGSAWLNSDDFELGISPGGLTSGNNPGAGSYLWYPSAWQGVPSGVSIASVKVADGYVVEAAIPWSVLGITASAGQQVGFALSVSDNDYAGQALQQTLVSSLGSRKLTNPNTWGILTLDN